MPAMNYFLNIVLNLLYSYYVYISKISSEFGKLYSLFFNGYRLIDCCLRSCSTGKEYFSCIHDKHMYAIRQSCRLECCQTRVLSLKGTSVKKNLKNNNHVGHNESSRLIFKYITIYLYLLENNLTRWPQKCREKNIFPPSTLKLQMYDIWWTHNLVWNWFKLLLIILLTLAFEMHCHWLTCPSLISL